MECLVKTFFIFVLLFEDNFHLSSLFPRFNIINEYFTAFCWRLSCNQRRFLDTHASVSVHSLILIKMF